MMQVVLVVRRLFSWRWAIPVTCLVTAVAVAVPTFALAQGSAVEHYTGCLNSGGNISNLAAGDQPKSACSTTQSQVHLSCGDITEVATPNGGGLQG